MDQPGFLTTDVHGRANLRVPPKPGKFYPFGYNSLDK